MDNKKHPAVHSVLIVEDEPAIRVMLEIMLEDMPVTVTAVATADEGLEELYRQHWHLIITDVQTPGSANGLHLARAARQHQPQVEVIVMSGYHNAMGLPLPPGVSFLAKPWTLTEFYTLVESHLAK